MLPLESFLTSLSVKAQSEVVQSCTVSLHELGALMAELQRMRSGQTSAALARSWGGLSAVAALSSLDELWGW